MGVIAKPNTFTTGVISPSEVNADFDTLYTLVNGNLDTANITDGTLTDGDMVTAIKPVTRYDENFQSHVESGMALSYSVLTATVAIGTAYVDGVRVVTSAASSNTFTAAGTYYVDLSKTGAFSWNQSASPATNYMRLYSITCDAAEITATTAIRPLTAVGATEIEVDACTKVDSAQNTASATTNSTAFTTLLDAGTVNVLSGDELVLTGKARVEVSGENHIKLGLNVGGSDLVPSSQQYISGTSQFHSILVHAVHQVTTNSAALPVMMMMHVQTTAVTMTATQRIVTIERFRR